MLSLSPTAGHAAASMTDDTTTQASRALARPHDSNALIEACVSVNIEQVRDILDSVLGDIHKGLTPDEAMSILQPPQKFLCPLAFVGGPRLAQAFVDALAPAFQDGRLSAAQVTRLLDGGSLDKPNVGLWQVFGNGFCSEAKPFLDSLRKFQGPGGLNADQLASILSGAVEGHPSPRCSPTVRTITKGSPADITGWFAEILALYQDQRIDAGHARSLMAGLTRDGVSAWHEALFRSTRESDATVILSVVRAWRQAIQAGLLPPDALRDGLLSRSSYGHHGLLAGASARHDVRWLSALFRELSASRHDGVLSEADLCAILDATLDTDGLAPRMGRGHRSVAELQLATFERLLNECIDTRVIDGAPAARLLLAETDGETSRSVRAAAFAGGHGHIHARLLADAERRGDLSPAQRTEALNAAHRLALAIYPPPPVVGGG